MRRLDTEVELAELNHRLVTYSQLRRGGLSSAQIRRRVRRDQLYPVLDRVYSVGPPTDDFLTRAIALCLRCPDGFLSGAASARYWELRRGIPNLLEFTVAPRGQPRAAQWALLRYSRQRAENDVFHADDGLRVSTPARTVLDCAHRLDQTGLRSMIESGLRKGLLTRDALKDVADRLCGRGRPGSRLFKLTCGDLDARVSVDSEEELIMFDALRDAGIDDVETQVPVTLPSGFTVHLDLGIRSSRTGLEIDGPRHDDPIAMHRDKSRDRLVAVQGWHVLRVVADEVRTGRPVVTAQVLAVHRQRLGLLGDTAA